mgnify:CR=1 FL=1
MGEAEVWLGREKKVSLVAKIDYFYTLRKSSKQNLKIKIVSSQDMVGKELSALEVHNVFVKNGSTNIAAERKRYRRQVKGGFNEKLVRYWERLHGASPKPLDELSN